MKKTKLPKTDSIQELAEFWDAHDLTGFEGELEEVTEPVFVHRTAIQVPLDAGEAKAIAQLAKAKGVSQGQLVRAWVLERLASRGNGRPATRRARIAKS